MKDPQRLIADPRAPAELREALRALEADTVSPELALRIARELSALPPPAAGLAAGALGGKLIVVSCALLGVAATGYVFATQHAPAARERSAAATQSAEPTARAPGPAAPPAPRLPPQSPLLPAPEPSSAWLPPQPSGAQKPPRRPARALPPASVPRVASGHVRAARERSSLTRGLEPAASATEGRAPNDPTLTPSAAGADSPALAASSANEPRAMAPASAASREPQDEAGLLYRAKHLAARDPGAALRLLELHARYFPNGALVEEREATAIRLLLRLGRAGEAAPRVRAFRRRFPRSVYRDFEP